MSKRKTGKALRLYEGGISGLMECAIRDDGAAFMRFQDRTPYGYRWGAWKRKPEKDCDPSNLPHSIEAGFSTLRVNTQYGTNPARLRLPA